MLLVFPQARPLDARLADGVAHRDDGADADDAHHRDRQDQAPDQAGKEQHVKPEAATRMAVPRSGCLAISPTGTSSSPRR